MSLGDSFCRNAEGGSVKPQGVESGQSGSPATGEVEESREEDCGGSFQ